jgi:hypothetical protein
MRTPVTFLRACKWTAIPIWIAVTLALLLHALYRATQLDAIEDVAVGAEAVAAFGTLAALLAVPFAVVAWPGPRRSRGPTVAGVFVTAALSFAAFWILSFVSTPGGAFPNQGPLNVAALGYLDEGSDTPIPSAEDGPATAGADAPSDLLVAIAPDAEADVTTP